MPRPKTVPVGLKKVHLAEIEESDLSNTVTSGAAAAAAAAKKARQDREIQEALRAAIRQKAPILANDIIVDIRRSLASASLIQLPPACIFKQTSHSVLLAGSLKPVERTALQARQELGVAPVPLAHAPCSGANETEHPTPPDGKSISKAVNGPKVLPWLWCDRQRCNASACMPMADVQTWEVGLEGASVVVCLTPDGDVPEAVWEAEEKGWDEAAQRAAQLSSFPIGSLSGGLSRELGGGLNGEGVHGDPAAQLSSASLSYSEDNQASLMGSAAAAVGREFSSLVGRLKRNKTTL